MVNNGIMSSRKARHYALYRLKGMVRNLVEIDMDVPISDMEREHLAFIQEAIEELIQKWGTQRWHIPVDEP